MDVNQKYSVHLLEYNALSVSCIGYNYTSLGNLCSRAVTNQHCVKPKRLHLPIWSLLINHSIRLLQMHGFFHVWEGEDSGDAVLRKSEEKGGLLSLGRMILGMPLDRSALPHDVTMVRSG